MNPVLVMTSLTASLQVSLRTSSVPVLTVQNFINQYKAINTAAVFPIKKKALETATVERILIQLKKKEQCEDLTLCTLEKEIGTLTETGMLHSNDNDSIFINNVLNAPTKEQIIVNNESEQGSDINDTAKS